MCGRLRVGKDFLDVCSIGRCAHVFGLCVRHSRPLAIMPSADQVPINNPHSTMLGGNWVVLIAGSTGSALRAVRPPNVHITPDVRRDCQLKTGTAANEADPFFPVCMDACEGASETACINAISAMQPWRAKDRLGEIAQPNAGHCWRQRSFDNSQGFMDALGRSNIREPMHPT